MVLSVGEEYPQILEIDVGEHVFGVRFTANDAYLVSNSTKDIRVWRVADGKQIATMKVQRVLVCVAASRDGRWIAAGTATGDLFVWNATTYQQAFTDRSVGHITCDVDFSPDSTRLVAAVSASDNKSSSATIWDTAARRKMQSLNHDRPLLAAKYSPQRDRIATATEKLVRVWDSGDGRSLVDVKVQGASSRCLLWRKNHLFVGTDDGKIKQIDAATGSIVSEWLVPHTQWPHIALPPHGKFIAHVAEKAITFWDTVTYTQLSFIRHTHDIYLTAYSSDGGLLAIASERKVIVKDLSFVQSCLVSVCSCPVFDPLFYICVFQEPELDIDSAALSAWERGQFTNAEALLSAAIPTSKNRHHVLASRALVLTRLGRWDAALIDAREVHVTPLAYTGADTILNQVHQNSPISRWLRCTECGPRWQGGKGQGD